MGNALTLQDPLLLIELLAVLGCLAAMTRLVLTNALHPQPTRRPYTSPRTEFLCVGTTISAPKKSLAIDVIRVCGK